jgi:ferrous iron transport protein B
MFVKRAGTVILAISIILWALAAFPRSSAADPATQVKNSYAGKTGRAIEPLIAPLGFDWRIGVGLISSFAARETIISTLSIVYNVGSESDDSKSLIAALRSARRADGSPIWTPLVALSLMMFFALACQCMSTLAIVRRETNSWRWPLFMVTYMLVLAYAASFLTYQGGRLVGLS